MKKYIISLSVLLISFINFAQTPQNVNPGKGKGESMWDSPTTIILIVVFILLMIVSRSWSKKVQAKRDELSKRNKNEDSESEGDVEEK